MGRFDEGMVDSDIEGYESNVNPVGELPGCPEGFMQASFELIAFWKIFWLWFYIKNSSWVNWGVHSQEALGVGKLLVHNYISAKQQQ